MIGFREICLITAALPLLTLLSCFIYAVVFQAEEVHETHCQVSIYLVKIQVLTKYARIEYLSQIETLREINFNLNLYRYMHILYHLKTVGSRFSCNKNNFSYIY